MADNPLLDIREHRHDKVRHTHAWGSFDHNHILREVCHRPECKDSETHNIHHREDVEAVYEETEDWPYG